MRFLILLIFISLACYTSTKLYHMAQVREWIPGARIERVTITKMWTTIHEGTNYYVGWDLSDYPALSTNKVCIFESIWQSLHEGDAIEVIHLGNSSEAHLRHDDIWASNGNFVFDFCLLALWLGIIGYQLFRIVRYKDY